MRRTFLRLFRWMSGLAILRFLTRNCVAILMVHGTMEANERQAWTPLRRQLSPERLDKTLQELKKHYRFVTLEDAVRILRREIRSPRNSIVLTFDDGYRNNITRALPVLRKHSVPAVFFLATGHVDRREPFWVDRLDYALQSLKVDGRVFRIGGEAVRIDAGDRGALEKSFRRLRNAAKKIVRDDAEMATEIAQLSSALEGDSGSRLLEIFEDDDWSAVASWNDVRKSAGVDVCFGSHTVDHIRLGLVGEDTCRDQLVRSREAIEGQTGVPCRYLCYPNGSFTRSTVRIAREAGYIAAVTTMEGTNRPGDDLMTLRRIPFPDTDDPTEILATVAGLSDPKELILDWMRSRGGNEPSCERRTGDA